MFQRAMFILLHSVSAPNSPLFRPSDQSEPFFRFRGKMSHLQSPAVSFSPFPFKNAHAECL